MDSNPLRRLHVVIDGRVQGVGFRNYVMTKADLLELTGWVRNVGDNQVEVLAEGETGRLTIFLDYLRRGPRSAFVTNLSQSWEPATGEFSYFDVHYSI